MSAWTHPHTGTDKNVDRDFICYKNDDKSRRSAWTPPHTGTDKHVNRDVIRYKNDHKSVEVSLDTSAYRCRQTRGL